ncbi:NmrA-like family protein [mine drainage metagenome]|uniref:NmrA-like family protein n=1 Tax=mine drainage metagenome TaxID=410659 RepID=A0A1J5SXU8_9ZZZZ
MKYVITGSIGHISKPIVTELVKEKHQVTVITSNSERIAEIQSLGAQAAVGSVEDIAFLTKTFTGANAVYTMVPPTMSAPDLKKHIGTIGENYAAAIKASAVKNVVNLSSIGAHMAEGCGPVSGIFFVEKALNSLENVNVKHLRPGYFYYNLFANINLIKNMNIIGSNYDENTSIVFADTSDIAVVAAEELLNLSFTGKTIRYIASDERKAKEVAGVIGNAIGKPQLPWINFPDEQTLGGMLQAGLPNEIAKNYVEMGTALRSGEMITDYHKNRPANFGKIKLEDFAKTFAAAYNA